MTTNKIKIEVWGLLLFMLMLLLLFVSFCLGTQNYSIADVYYAIFHYKNTEKNNIIMDIRMPREIAAVLVGMALACSGAIMQGVTKNALADPSLLGLNAGASMVIALLLSFNSGTHFIILMIGGFLGAMIGGAIVMFIGMSKRGGFNTMRIVLAGAAVSALLSALASGIALYSQANQSINLYSVAGGVAGTTWTQVAYVAPVIIAIIILTTIFARQLTALSLGEEMAQGLGVNITAIRTAFSILTMILAGVAVAIVGSLAFVGLMVPHIARFIVGRDYRFIIPFSAILGGIFIVSADIVARMMGESPLGAIISIIGVPFFIYLVRKDGKLI